MPEQAARLDELAKRLEARARGLDRRKDSRAVFTTAYVLMTRRIAAELGSAADPGWIAALAEAFAARYELALDAWDGSGDLPPAWGKVFATICARRTSVVEDLVFAMTAHIVRDLPHALLDVGLRDARGRPHLHDFHLVNGVIGRCVDDVQRTVSRRYARYVAVLDRLGKRYDEILTNYGVRLSRGMAWYNAMRLEDPDEGAAAAASIERSPQVVVDEVMNPPVWSLRLALRTLRWLLAHLRKWPEHGAVAASG